MVSVVAIWVVCLFTSAAFAESPLAPVKLDNPRDTMRTFMTNMNFYRKGVLESDPKAKKKIQVAMRTLDLSDVPPLIREEKGREAAIFLKEVIDRVIKIDYSKIPKGPTSGPKALLRWRLKDTEITILRVGDGERQGEYLFSASTVARAPDFFETVHHLPYAEGVEMAGAAYRRPWIQKFAPNWIQGQTLGLSHLQWLVLLGTLLTMILLHRLLPLLVILAARVPSKLGKGVVTRVMESVAKPLGWVTSGAILYLSLTFAQVRGGWFTIGAVFAQVFVSYGVILAGYRLVDVLLMLARRSLAHSGRSLDEDVIPLIETSLRVMVIIIGVLVALQNLGVNVVSVIAGLGIGGLAIALAAQDTVANLFGSAMIFLDRPFAVGDWVNSEGHEGTVEAIGFRSTRIRTFYDSQVSIPNSVIANAKIDNMGRRTFRRSYSVLGVTYDTPPEKLEAFMQGIENIILANEFTRKDKVHVAFSGYGDFSLQIMVYFFLRVGSWADELVERQNVFLEILRLAHELGVQFAFPTQTLHVDSFPGQSNPVTQNFGEKQLREVPKQFSASGNMARPKGLGYFQPAHRREV